MRFYFSMVRVFSFIVFFNNYKFILLSLWHNISFIFCFLDNFQETTALSWIW